MVLQSLMVAGVMVMVLQSLWVSMGNIVSYFLTKPESDAAVQLLKVSSENTEDRREKTEESAANFGQVEPPPADHVVTEVEFEEVGEAHETISHEIEGDIEVIQEDNALNVNNVFNKAEEIAERGYITTEEINLNPEPANPCDEKISSVVNIKPEPFEDDYVEPIPEEPSAEAAIPAPISKASAPKSEKDVSDDLEIIACIAQTESVGSLKATLENVTDEDVKVSGSIEDSNPEPVEEPSAKAASLELEIISSVTQTESEKSVGSLKATVETVDHEDVKVIGSIEESNQEPVEQPSTETAISATNSNASTPMSEKETEAEAIAPETVNDEDVKVIVSIENSDPEPVEEPSAEAAIPAPISNASTTMSEKETESEAIEPETVNEEDVKVIGSIEDSDPESVEEPSVEASCVEAEIPAPILNLSTPLSEKETESEAIAPETVNDEDVEVIGSIENSDPGPVEELSAEAAIPALISNASTTMSEKETKPEAIAPETVDDENNEVIGSIEDSNPEPFEEPSAPISNTSTIMSEKDVSDDLEIIASVAQTESETSVGSLKATVETVNYKDVKEIGSIQDIEPTGEPNTEDTEEGLFVELPDPAETVGEQTQTLILSNNIVDQKDREIKEDMHDFEVICPSKTCNLEESIIPSATVLTQEPARETTSDRGQEQKQPVAPATGQHFNLETNSKTAEAVPDVDMIGSIQESDSDMVDVENNDPVSTMETVKVLSTTFQFGLQYQ